MLVEKRTLLRGEIKTQFRFPQDSESLFLRVILERFGHPGQGFFQLSRSGVQR